MDFKKINKIIELFNESGLGEMSIEQGDLKITVKSKEKEIVAYETVVKENNLVSEVTKENVKKEDEINGSWIKAPFVGTYYAAPSENAQPYIKVGQKVNEGDVLCILEAMKVMNEIKAEKSGTILEINVENGEMVEYDKKLILIGE